MLLTVGLAACGPSRLDRLTGLEGLDREIRLAYRAAQPNDDPSICNQINIRSITEAALVEETPERLVIDLRYKYYDRLEDELFLGRINISPTCEGFATRRFTVLKFEDELRVAEIGPSRDVAPLP